jgi:hypothetical protein
MGPILLQTFVPGWPYLDPSNNATDEPTSILLSPEPSVITSNGTNTGTEASGQVYAPAGTVLRDGDLLTLVYPDGTEVVFAARFTNNGHGRLEYVEYLGVPAPAVVCRCGEPATANAYGASCDQWPLCDVVKPAASVIERLDIQPAAVEPREPDFVEALLAAATPEPAVWMPRTADERRHVAVAELVAETMASRPKRRYARAWGILSGLVASGTGDIRTRWATDFAAEMNKAFANRES